MTIEDIALQMTPGIGVKGAVHLLGIFGDARGIFSAAPEELAMKAALREDIIRNIVHLWVQCIKLVLTVGSGTLLHQLTHF